MSDAKETPIDEINYIKKMSHDFFGTISDRKLVPTNIFHFFYYIHVFYSLKMKKVS